MSVCFLPLICKNGDATDLWKIPRKCILSVAQTNDVDESIEYGIWSDMMESQIVIRNTECVEVP